MNAARIFPVIFGLVGLGILAVAIMTASVRLELLADGVRTEGVVVRLAGGGGNSDRSYYYPIVRFRAASGETFVFRGETGTRPPAFEQGEEVTVIYHSDNPEVAVIDSFWSLWFLPVLFGAFGLVFSGLALAALVWQIRVARQAAWLRAHGRPVTAEVTAIEPVTPEALLRRARWKVTARWREPGSRKVHRFAAHEVALDSKVLSTGDTIPVRIDPDDPKRYWMDLSGLART